MVVIPAILTATKGALPTASHYTNLKQPERDRSTSTLIVITGQLSFSPTLISTPFTHFCGYTTGASTSVRQLISPPSCLNYDRSINPKAELLTSFKGFSASLRQLANDPIWFQRVIEPVFCPASLDTAFDGPLADFLTQAVEKRQFAAWLIQATHKPCSLPLCRASGTGGIFVRHGRYPLRFHDHEPPLISGNFPRRK